MSLLSHLFKLKTAFPERASHRELVESAGLLLLAAHEKRDDSLRHSTRFGELLSLLWQNDKQAFKTVNEVFSSSVESFDRAFVEAFSQRLRILQPALPPSPESRFEAVVHALRLELQVMVAPAMQDVLPSGATRRLINTLTLIRLLLPAELHEPVCAFLVAYNRNHLSGSNDNISSPRIREQIYRYLASLPPQSIPTFWAMLRDEAVSQEFWPVLRRIRDRNAVPYLLELLPEAQANPARSALSFAGQKAVVQALKEIGDPKAIPVLLAMEKQGGPGFVRPAEASEPGLTVTDNALQSSSGDRPSTQSAWDRWMAESWHERTELARLAGQAARHIQRNSPDAGAQLLRPSEMPSTDDGTLLRPASPDAGTTPPNELMRPSVEPEQTKRTS